MVFKILSSDPCYAAMDYQRSESFTSEIDFFFFFFGCSTFFLLHVSELFNICM